MQIAKIQAQNRGTTFGANVKIIGGDLNKKAITSLSEKAKKIGLDNDVIELKFTNWKHNQEGYYCGQDNCYIGGVINELKETFRAKFIPNGKGKCTEEKRDKILSNSYADLLKEEERVANNYLDELIKKYGN